MSGAHSYEVRLNCSLIAGRFELEPLSYWSDVTDEEELQQLNDHFSQRLQYSGVSQCM